MTELKDILNAGKMQLQRGARAHALRKAAETVNIMQEFTMRGIRDLQQCVCRMIVDVN